VRIVVAGSGGLIGQALLPVLRDGGHQVLRLVRRPAQTSDEATWDPALGRLDPEVLDGADAVIDLAGASFGPATRERRREFLSSRVRTAGLLARTIRRLDAPPSVMLQASATGAYGDRGDDVLTEAEPFGSTYLADVVRRWETAAEPAAESCRLVLLRSGIVLSPTGGALRAVLPLVRAGLGARLGSGRQFWSWITLADEVRAIEHLLRADVHGPVNLVAGATRNAEMVATLASTLRRPAALAVPAAPLRLVLGPFAEELFGSTRAEPAALRASGFRFSHPDIESAARWIRACL